MISSVNDTDEKGNLGVGWSQSKIDPWVSYRCERQGFGTVRCHVVDSMSRVAS